MSLLTTGSYAWAGLTITTFWSLFTSNLNVQYCAKVMRTNFAEFRALFSSKYRQTFDRYFAAFERYLMKFRRQFAKASEKSNRKIVRLIEKSLVRIFEAAKYRRRFMSNQMKYPPTFRLQDKRPINVISHGKT